MLFGVPFIIIKGSIDAAAFGWLWPRIPSHAHTSHTGLAKDARKGKGKATGKYLVVTSSD